MFVDCEGRKSTSSKCKMLRLFPNTHAQCTFLGILYVNICRCILWQNMCITFTCLPFQHPGGEEVLLEQAGEIFLSFQKT